jgi:co-chaperonin GroES (HSP10)
MIQAVADKVVVQEMKLETSKGGLIIPESVQQPQAYGRVMSVGDKVETMVTEGDVLVFHTNGGMAMVVEGKVLRCLMENEIYGIVKSDEIIDALTMCEVKQKDLDQLDKALKNVQDQTAGGSRIVRV